MRLAHRLLLEGFAIGVGDLGHHQHRRHAEVVRHGEIAGDVLEQDGARRVDPVRLQEPLVGRALGLGTKLAAAMSNTSSKWSRIPSLAATFSAWRRDPLFRISLRPGSSLDRVAEVLSRSIDRVVDVMGEVEEVVRVDPSSSINADRVVP